MNETIKRIHNMGLGTYSDWFVRLPASRVVQREDALLYQTPTRPDFWFGNYAVCLSSFTIDGIGPALSHFAAVPGQARERASDIVQWELPLPGIDLDALPKLKDVDVDLNLVRVLTLNDDLCRHRSNGKTDKDAADSSALCLRPVITEEDAQEALTILLEQQAEGQAAVDEDFVHWLFAQHWQAIQQGRGNWWLLDDNGTPVATCGLYVDGENARFQEVITRPGHRGKGYATRLCQAVVDHAVDMGSITRLIIVSEPGSTADHIYERLGFTPASYQLSCIRRREQGRNV